MIILKDMGMSRGDVVEIDGGLLTYIRSTYAGEEVGFSSYMFKSKDGGSISHLGQNNRVKSFKFISRPSYEFLSRHLGIPVESLARAFSKENLIKAFSKK